MTTRRAFPGLFGETLRQQLRVSNLARAGFWVISKACSLSAGQHNQGLACFQPLDYVPELPLRSARQACTEF